MSRPKLNLKLELFVPSDGEKPPQKFCVNRALKAHWGPDPNAVTESILQEIKNYNGSFIGDVTSCLHSVVNSESAFVTQEQTRELDVTRWLCSVFDSLIMSSINDGIHEEIVENEKVVEWDGDVRDIGPIKQSEVKNTDMEKLLILLAPRIKHAATLISKKLPK
jgi:hypothetical protein